MDLPEFTLLAFGVLVAAAGAPLPKVRSWTAVAAHARRAARDMGNKRGKGRQRRDQRTRAQARRDARP